MPDPCTRTAIPSLNRSAGMVCAYGRHHGGCKLGIPAELVDQGLNFFSHQAFNGAAIGALMGGGHRS